MLHAIFVVCRGDSTAASRARDATETAWVSPRIWTGLKRLVWLVIVALLPVVFSVEAVRGQGSTDSDLVARLINRLTTTVAEDEGKAAFVPPPREVVRPLVAAAKALQQKKYGVAAQTLGDFLTGDLSQDYLLQIGDADAISLRNAARELLASIPSEELGDYQLKFSAIAEQQLERGLETGDRKILANVSSRYFFTDAGMQATMLLGHLQLEQGELVAAAAAFQRIVNYPKARQRYEPEASVLLATSLLLVGNEPAAQIVLADLVERNNAAARRAPLKFLDNNVELPRSSDVALEWLVELIGRSPLKVNTLMREWRMVSGNPQRNAASLAGLPLFVPNWSVSIHPDEATETEMRNRLARKIAAGAVVIPALKPLAVENMIIMRNAAQMIGVDFQSGKRVWVYPPENPIVTPQKSASGDARDEAKRESSNAGVENRIMFDSIYGEASSDGKSIFVIPRTASIEAPSLNDEQMTVGDPFGDATDGTGANVLNAVRLDRQGALRWQVGGISGHEEPKLANVQFYGAPLPLDGILYAICRQKEVILLTAIDSESGKLIWSQQLAVSPIQDYDEDEVYPTTTTGSLSPSFSNGILVCPTGLGTLVGVSVDDRSLLWGFNFHKAGMEIDPFAQGFTDGAPIYGSQTGASRDAWLENRIVIDQGLVAFTPRFEREMVVLDLLSGRPIRSATSVGPSAQSRGALFLGCINAGRALVVAIDHCRLVDLYSGREIWRTELQSFGSPSGTGFFTSESYYLPTTSAEVIEISLSNGEITRSNVAPQVLGNLIVYRGSIVSHGLDRLISIAQDQPAEQLLARLPKEAVPTWNMELVKAQLLVQKGDIRGAIEAAENAWRINPNDIAKKFLATFYTQQMFRDPEFASPVMKQLSDNDAVLRLQLRLAAMEQMDDQRAANLIWDILRTAQSEELAQVVEIPWQLGTKDNRKSAAAIRLDRWLGTRLSNAIQGGQATEAINRILESVQQLNISHSTRWQLYAGIGFANLSSERLVAAAKLFETTNSHGAEEMLRIAGERLDGPVAETAAVAHLNNLLTQNRLVEALAFCESMPGSTGDPKLQAKISEVRARMDVIGPENQLSGFGRNALCRRLNGGEWDGDFRDATVGNSTVISNFSLGLQQPSEPTFKVFGKDNVIAFDRFGAPIIAFRTTDSSTAELSEKDQELSSSRRMIVGGNSYDLDDNGQWGPKLVGNCFSRGNRRLLHTDQGLWVLQLDYSNLEESVCLWSRTKIDLGKLSRGSLPASFGGTGTKVVRNAFLAMITEQDEVVYCDAGSLRCVNALDGLLIWQASGSQPVSHLLIHGREVVAYDSQVGVVRKFSLGDGRLLKTVQGPPDLEFATTTENLLIGIRRERGEETLVGYDPFEEKTVWARRMNPKSKAHVFGLDRLALIEPRGALQLVDLKTGTTTGSMSIPYGNMATSNIWGLDVHQVGDRLLVSVLTKAPEASIDFNRDTTWIRLNQINTLAELSTGYLFCVDAKSSEPKWESPLRFEGMQWLIPEASHVSLLVGMRRFDLNSYERDLERMEHQYYFIDLVTGEQVARIANAPVLLTSWSLRAFPTEKKVWAQLGASCLELNFQTDGPPRPRSQLTLRRALPAPSEWLTVKTEVVSVPVSRAKIIERLKKAQEELDANRQELQKKLREQGEK
ncbi:MAG: PQQ-binding-like beta-propeller repeat protein [Pirellulaceae bacterium]